MKYFIFLTKEEAEQKNLEIYNSLNINPVGVNAATGQSQPDAQQTLGWDIVQQLTDGRWYISSPDETGEEIPEELFVKVKFPV